MKTFILSTLFMLATAMSVFAQGYNLIFFTPEGEGFYVIINGVRQNDQPQTNVMVKGVNAAMFKVKIIFEDKSLGEIDKNLPMPEEPSEITYQIKKGKSGEYVLRFYGAVPLSQAPPPPADRNVIVYTTTPTTASTTVTQTTTTTTGTAPAGENVNVNMGVNVPGVNMGVNVNVQDNTNANYQQNTTVTQTTTTTGTTTTGTAVRPAPTDNDHYVMPGYNGPVGCSWPMSDADFASAKQSISSKNFEDSKLTMAKQIFNTNCMTSAQVKEVMMLFTYEDSKLDFAKYAYGHTFDLGNYYKVNDAFTYETSIDELNEYIQGR